MCAWDILGQHRCMRSCRPEIEGGTVNVLYQSEVLAAARQALASDAVSRLIEGYLRPAVTTGVDRTSDARSIYPSTVFRPTARA